MSKKPPNITKEERLIFRQAMQATDPARRPKFDQPLPPSLRNRPIAESPPLPHDLPAEISFEYFSAEDWIKAEDCLNFARPGGVPTTYRQRFVRGQLPVEAKLDLHGLTTAEAIQSMTVFFQQCVQARKRCVLLVHGKGKFQGENKPKLKNLVNAWLPHHPDILAFHSARPQHGGTGAVYVLLKLGA